MSTRASTSRACKRVNPTSDVVMNSDSDLSDLTESEDGDSADATAPGDKGKGKRVAPPRKIKKLPPPLNEDDEPVEDSESEPDSEEEYGKKQVSNRKKSIKGKGKGKGKKGGLERLLTLPLELFYEVCSHLESPDLVRLSLLSRNIRDLLVSPSSQHIWTSARRAIGLPDLTSDNMNEIQYAHLVFWNKCQRCCDATVPHADYWLRNKLCKPCRKIAWLKNDMFQSKGLHPSTQFCVAFTTGRFSLLLSLVLAHAKKSFGTSATPTGWGSHFRYAHEPDAKIISQKLFDLEAEDEAYNTANAPPRPSKKSSRAAPTKAPHPIQSTFVKSTLLSDYVESRKVLIEKMRVDAKTLEEEVNKIERAARIARSAKKMESQEVESDRREEIYESFIPFVRRLSQPSERPLFGDFLNLPSVLPFWEDVDAVFDEDEWSDSLPALHVEIENHRTSTRIYAIKTILAATTDTAFEELDDDPAAYDENSYPENFFSFATSFLFCTIPNCRTKGGWAPGYTTYVQKRRNFFGSFFDVLAHQHEAHSDVRFDEPSNGHFELPGFVADAMATISESLNADPDELTVADLETAWWYEWTNAKSKRSWNWRDLLAVLPLPALPSESLSTPKAASAPHLVSHGAPNMTVTPVIHLPRITIQHTFPTVVSEIISGAHSAEDIWISVYKQDEASVHGRARVTGDEDESEVELTARDGVVVEKVSNNELRVACPALKVEPTSTHFPLATPFSLRGGIDAVAVHEGKGSWVVGGKDGAVRVGDVRGDRRVLDLKGHVADVGAVAFFPSGEVVLTASSDMSLRIFSAIDGSNPRTFTGHTKPISSISILGIGRLVAAASLDGSLRIWNVSTSTIHEKILFTQPISAMIIGPSPSPSPPSISDSQSPTDLPPNLLAFLAHTNGSISLIPLSPPPSPEMRKIITLDTGSKSPLHAVAYDAKSGLVAAGARDGTISLFEIKDKEGALTEKDVVPSLVCRRSDATVTSLAFSPSPSEGADLPTLVVGTADGLPFRASIELGEGEEQRKVKVVDEYAGGDCESMVVTLGGEGQVWVATQEGKLRRYKARV
ncbi:proteasomal ATPase-associated factor 1, partial [Phenoliferia sp. Uapishka_3]